MLLTFKEIDGAFLFPMFVAVITDDNGVQASYEVDALMHKALEDAFKAGQDKEKREQQVHIKTEEEAQELAAFFNKESVSRTPYLFAPYKQREGDWRLHLMKGDSIIQEHFALHKSQRHTVMLLCDAINKEYTRGVENGKAQILSDGLLRVADALGVGFPALNRALNTNHYLGRRTENES